MHDIRAILADPEKFDEMLSRRGFEPQAQKLVGLDEKRREAISALQDTQEKRNAISKEIGQAMASKDLERAETLKAQVSAMKDLAPQLTQNEQEANEALHTALSQIPNLPFENVPLGKDEHDNVEALKFGTPRQDLPSPLDHVALGENLGLMDFEAAARMSGARFVVLKGGLAKLERALTQFMLNLHTTEHGYTEVNPPLLVRDATMFGTAQLPKFAEDQFKMSDDPLWLIPTAEVSLTNLVREQILPEKELPLRYTAATACFRREAGSAGRDTRGMIRQHQFTKVELVSITTPEQSEDEHERMSLCAQEVLKRLELPYRMVTLCTGDMGFAARKTYDLEVWLPSQGQYREISSCSNCGDFQARRMDARMKGDDGKGTRFVHTLNGSGVAVGRALVAILENYQNTDGSITVPEVLRPFMGVDVLKAG